MNKSNGIWVFIENMQDGGIREVSIELLTPARMLADKLNVALTAIVIGEGTETIISKINNFHIDTIIAVEKALDSHCATAVYTSTLEFLIRKYQPAGLLIGATKVGRSFAPRLSCRLDTGLTADCTGLDIDLNSGLIAWTRPTFGGKLMATIVCDTYPQMGTVRPGIYKKPQISTESAQIIREQVPSGEGEGYVKLLETIAHEVQEYNDLDQAKIIVAAGRGKKDKAGIQMVKELAGALGGSYGATRAVIDQGLMEYNRLIGQTGLSVNPDLYIACGVSGALQHTIGIAESAYVVAINTDPDAPIFELANVGIVGDVQEVLPAIINALKKRKIS